MPKEIETAVHDRAASISNPSTDSPTVSTRLHTVFVEIKIHTAKCDSCEKTNKLTLYRCADCGQHVCTLCRNKKSGDGTHVFDGGSRVVPESSPNHVIEKGDEAEVKNQHRNQRARRRVHVIGDHEDDEVPVLKPAPTTQRVESNDAIMNQQTNKNNNNVIHHNLHHADHGNNLPRLWPKEQAQRLPMLRPAASTINTNAAEFANRMTQENLQTHANDNDSTHQRTVRFYDNSGRQKVSSPYTFVGDQQETPQTRYPPQSIISHQQAIRSAPLPAQPTMSQPRPGPLVDQQAARNQLAFANTQPRNYQTPRTVQPLSTYGQANYPAPLHPQPAIYRPRPGVDLDRQAARNELSFANRPRESYQAPRPGQPSTSQQQALRLAPRPAQATISPQDAHTRANLDQLAAHNQQAFRLHQQAQADAHARQMEAHKRQALSSHQNARPAANSDQVAAYNQQAFLSNQRSFLAANHPEQVMIAAGDRQQALISQQQANRTFPSSARTSISSPSATDSSSFPSQAFLYQQHAALLASRQAQQGVATQDRSHTSSGGNQVRQRPPPTLQAIDVLLSHAGVQQSSEGRSRSTQDAHGVSQLLSAASQLDEANPTSSRSHSSPKALVGGSGAAGMFSTSPRDPAVDAHAKLMDAESAKAPPTGSQSTSGTHSTVSDLPVSPHVHSNNRNTTSHSDLGPKLAGLSAARPYIPSFRRASSYPGPVLPVSDHAAVYLNQWNLGRAALSSSVSSTPVDVPTTRLNHPPPPVPAPHPQASSVVPDTTASGSESGGAVEAGTQAASAPKPAPGEHENANVVMGSPDIEMLDDDKPPRGDTLAPQEPTSEVEKDKIAEDAHSMAPEPLSGLHAEGEGRAGKHPRGEKESERETSKEHKSSEDGDVGDARKRNSKEKQIADDDGSDIEITSWNKTDSNKDEAGSDIEITFWNKTDSNNEFSRDIEITSWNKLGSNKDAESGRAVKKGVARVVRRGSKGRKRGTTSTVAG